MYTDWQGGGGRRRRSSDLRRRHKEEADAVGQESERDLCRVVVQGAFFVLIINVLYWATYVGVRMKARVQIACCEFLEDFSLCLAFARQGQSCK